MLEYLVDIRSEDVDDESSFKLTFEFAENPFFENKLLVCSFQHLHVIDDIQIFQETAMLH